MAQTFQMVRDKLSARSMAIREDNGIYVVSHKASKRWPMIERFDALNTAFQGGLNMASRREAIAGILGN